METIDSNPFESLEELVTDGVVFTDTFRGKNMQNATLGFNFVYWSPIDEQIFQNLRTRTETAPENSDLEKRNTMRTIHINPPQPIPGSIYTIPTIFNFDASLVRGGANSLQVNEKCSQKPISIEQTDSAKCFNTRYSVWENFNLLLHHLYLGNTQIDECLYTRIADYLKMYIELVVPIRVTFDSSIRNNHVGFLLRQKLDGNLLGL